MTPLPVTAPGAGPCSRDATVESPTETAFGRSHDWRQPRSFCLLQPQYPLLMQGPCHHSIRKRHNLVRYINRHAQSQADNDPQAGCQRRTDSARPACKLDHSIARWQHCLRPLVANRERRSCPAVKENLALFPPAHPLAPNSVQASKLPLCCPKTTSMPAAG